MSGDPRQIAIDGEKMAWRRMLLGDDGRLHEDGKLAMGWLLRECRVFGRTDARAADGGIDALSMAHMEGSRSVALRLMMILGLDLPGLVETSEGER